MQLRLYSDDINEKVTETKFLLACVQAVENEKLEIPPAQKLHILSSAHRTHGSALLNVFICPTHVLHLHECKYTALTFHIFGSFNAMKTKIPRSIQCNNMSSFIAIVLVDVNIITIYEL